MTIPEPMLKYGIDLTDVARKGDIDPIIGRDDEIRNMIKILSLKKKNNPIIVSEPGVGKTALVEGLAIKIASGDVPDILKEKDIFALDITALQAVQHMGELERNIKDLMDYIKNSDGRILLFIDEIHRIVGDGLSDIGNLLKPYLARNFGCIGCTTLDEYRHIEKDPALDRRFQKMVIKEPSIESAISILRGVKSNYEIYHKVTIKDSAIISAVKLTDRYITDKFLPDKALSVLDDACASLRVTLDSKPDKIYEVEQEILNLQIEQQSLETEEDVESQERRMLILNNIAELTKELESLYEQWEYEKGVIESLLVKRKTLDNMHKLLEEYESKSDLAHAAAIRHKLIPSVEKEIELLEKEQEDLTEQGKLLKEAVSDDSVADAIALKTGIPVKKMMSSDKEKVLQIPSELKKRVIGQDEAIEVLYKGVLRSKSGVQNTDKPISAFFLGSSGVGKTELAKALAEQLYDSEESMVRLDMSEYMEKHTVSRLIGAPSGYIGYEEGGQLTEQVFRKPYSLVLFDEIEKAHPDVLNVLLQVLDDGRLTDSKGRTVDFKNTIIIMTSNIGAMSLLDDIEQYNKVTDETKTNVKMLLNSHFRPEFINRIDDIVYFNPLTKEVVLKIVDKQLRTLNKRLEHKKIKVEINQDAKEYIADNGYDMRYGARPLQRYIQNTVETKIAEGIMKNEIEDGNKVTVYYDKLLGDLNLEVE